MPLYAARPGGRGGVGWGGYRDLVIPRLKKVAGQSRLLVMLRDPVKRAYSHYQMAVDPEGTPAQLRSRGE